MSAIDCVPTTSYPSAMYPLDLHRMTYIYTADVIRNGNFPFIATLLTALSCSCFRTPAFTVPCALNRPIYI
jgi:hypothetical protein